MPVEVGEAPRVHETALLLRVLTAVAPAENAASASRSTSAREPTLSALMTSVVAVASAIALFVNRCANSAVRSIT